QIPRTLDTLVGGQYQLTRDLKLEVDYRYRRCVNDYLGADYNRFTGDLLVNGGVLKRLNPNFESMTLVTNLGQRFYHGVIFALSKRFSQAWSLSASYTHNYSRDNINGNDTQNTGQTVTDPFNPTHEFARDEIPHVFL